jgi:hypothetical protein
VTPGIEWSAVAVEGVLNMFRVLGRNLDAEREVAVEEVFQVIWPGREKTFL